MSEVVQYRTPDYSWAERRGRGFGLPPVGESERSTEPTEFHREYGQRLAKVILLPEPDTISETADADQNGFEPALPPTTLDTIEVKRLLNSKNNTTTPDIRVMNLLAYAWNAKSIIGRPVPPEILSYITDSPSDWYKLNQKQVSGIISSSRSSDPHNRNRFDLEYLREDTQLYENSDFLRNAVRINKISFMSPEGEAVEVSVRLMIQEAAKKAKGETFVVRR